MVLDIGVYSVSRFFASGKRKISDPLPTQHILLYQQINICAITFKIVLKGSVFSGDTVVIPDIFRKQKFQLPLAGIQGEIVSDKPLA